MVIGIPEEWPLVKQQLERERKQEKREHVRCGPTIEDYRGTTVDPDAVVPGIDATTGLSLHTPIGPPLPRLGNRLRLFVEKVVPASLRSSLFEIADAIDRDAASTEPR